MSRPTTAELWQWNMRDRQRFKKLALPHLNSVFRTAYYLAGPDRAEDLVQETFLRAWTHFDQFAPGTNCRAWLMRILHNVWVSQWRKTRLELTTADLENGLMEPRTSIEAELTEGDLSPEMQCALGQLPEAYRLSVWLADVEELTYQEIAAAMECPIGTVMSRISRGRRMLASLLRERRDKERPPTLRIVAREG